MIALGIDPDTKNTGIAIVSCGAAPKVLYVATAKVKASLPVERRIRELVGVIATELLLAPTTPVERVIVEGQRIYPRGKARPNDLIHLAQVAGIAVAQASLVYPLAALWIPEPAQWKGTVEKAALQRRILKRIGLTEKLEGVNGVQGMTKTQRGHVIDAIGLALWANTIPARSKLNV
jgi:Holliday junction resolvasome RuvABC endonuclease subunit